MLFQVMAFNNFVYNNHNRRVSIDSCSSSFSSSSSSSSSGSSSAFGLGKEDAKIRLSSMWTSLEKKLQHPRHQEARWMEQKAGSKSYRRQNYQQ